VGVVRGVGGEAGDEAGDEGVLVGFENGVVAGALVGDGAAWSADGWSGGAEAAEPVGRVDRGVAGQGLREVAITRTVIVPACSSSPPCTVTRWKATGSSAWTT